MREQCEVCGAKVLLWFTRFETGVVHCKTCFGSPAAKTYIEHKKLEAENAMLGKDNDTNGFNEKPYTLNAKVNEESSLISELLGRAYYHLNRFRIKYSFISNLLFIIAVISLIASLVGSYQSLPLGYDYSLSMIYYIPSVIWIFGGVTSFALFSALGQGLHYLSQIATNTNNAD